ncbi:MAG: hypothetical protein ACI4LX_08530 [Treponema sp.]
MKNYKKNLTAFFVGLLSFFCFADGKNFTLSVEPCFGMRNGILNEFVYANAMSDNREYHLSVLDWELRSALYYGADADVGFSNFHIVASWKSFIPNSFGRMYDSDYMQDYYYGTNRTDLRTNYSVSENHVISGLNLALAFKYEFNVNKYFSISPVIEVSYENYFFKAKNGTAYYGSAYEGYSDEKHFYAYDDVENRDVYSLPGDHIDLRRYDFFTWIGFETLFRTNDGRWIFSLNLACSPYTYIYTHDSHLLRSLYFIDISQGVFSVFKGKTFAQFNITEKFGVRLSVAGLFSAELKGIEYISKSFDGEYKKDSGVIGAASQYFDVQLSAVASF